MATPATPLPPGSMTVPPLFGWELILTGLVVLVVVAVAFLLVSASGTGRDERPDWQAWLDARSGRRDTASLAGVDQDPGEEGRQGVVPVQR
jgi:hypothetical protein